MAILEKILIRTHRQKSFPSSADDHRYAPLSGLDANLQDSSSFEDLVPSKSCRQRVVAWLATAHTAFWFLTSVALFVAYVKKQPTDQQCVKQLNVYSPAVKHVEYETVEYENQFDHQTKYRGPPTRELEAAWHALYNYRGVSIPPERMASLNRSDEFESWKLYGSGPGYLAQLGVFHQLHCLNFIRQYTWDGYYARHPERVDVPAAIGLDSEVGRRMHADHCLESIRIALMCHADITPVGLVRLDDEAPMGGRPDFSPLRKKVNVMSPDCVIDLLNAASGPAYMVSAEALR
ncbi:hypothetical protein MBLNU13_g08852t1 [Cladosporium sp. NU13]